jgi:hypothetical protein
MQTHTIIKYKIISYTVQAGNTEMQKIYNDDTEKSFVDYDNAMAYKAYLDSKLEAGENTDYYTKELHQKDQLDIDGLIRDRALSLLSEEDKRVLGIN